MAYCYRSFDINVNQLFACSNYNKHAYLYTHTHKQKGCKFRQALICFFYCCKIINNHFL